MQLLQNLVQPRKFPLGVSMYITLLSALLQPCRLHSLGDSRTTDSTGGWDEKSRASKCMHHKPNLWSLVRYLFLNRSLYWWGFMSSAWTTEFQCPTMGPTNKCLISKYIYSAVEKLWSFYGPLSAQGFIQSLRVLSGGHESVIPLGILLLMSFR